MTIAMMKKFAKTARLQADSTEEIVDLFAEAVWSVRRKLKFRNRVLEAGPLLNALALQFAEHDDATRLSVARKAVGRLEQFLGDDADKNSLTDVEPAPKPTKPRTPQVGQLGSTSRSPKSKKSAM